MRACTQDCHIVLAPQIQRRLPPSFFGRARGKSDDAVPAFDSPAAGEIPLASGKSTMTPELASGSESLPVASAATPAAERVAGEVLDLLWLHARSSSSQSITCNNGSKNQKTKNKKKKKKSKRHPKSESPRGRRQDESAEASSAAPLCFEAVRTLLVPSEGSSSTVSAAMPAVLTALRLLAAAGLVKCSVRTTQVRAAVFCGVWWRSLPSIPCCDIRALVTGRRRCVRVVLMFADHRSGPAASTFRRRQ